MASRSTGSAQASPVVLPFPQTRKAIRHYETGMAAAGLLSLQILDRDGGQIPENVRRYDQPAEPSRANGSAEMLLALCMWGTLPAETQESIKGIVRAIAYTPNANPAAIQLHEILTGRAAPA